VEATGRAPRVLLIDDEELIREIVKMLAEDEGWSLLTAKDGIEGVEIFEEHKDEVDLVFIDFSMPKKTGYETYLDIREKNSGVKVVFISGLVPTPEIKELSEKG